MPGSRGKAWHLAADIGGSNVRLALAGETLAQLENIRIYKVSEYRTFTGVLDHYLAEVAALGEWQPKPRQVCMAVACPVEGDVLQLINSPWVIERGDVSRQLGNASVECINDFAAVGYAIANLDPLHWHQIGPGAPAPGRAIAVLGPGTGLGVSSVIPNGTKHLVVEGEGGHVDFAATSALEYAVQEVLAVRFGRVSVERLLSGAGILNIYQALAQLEGSPALQDSPEAVTRAAMRLPGEATSDQLAHKALSMFCGVLGSVAGNLALTLGAKGGVYIAGGIVPGLIDFIEQSSLRQRFESKGRYADYLKGIPLRIVTHPNPGLAGALNRLRLARL